MPRLLLAGFHWGRGRDYTYFARTNENHPTSRICFFGWQTKLHPVLSTYSTSHLPFPVWHWGREDWSTHLSYFDGSQVHPARHSSNELWYSCPKRIAEIWSLEKHWHIYISTEHWRFNLNCQYIRLCLRASGQKTSHGTFSCRDWSKEKSWTEQTLLAHQFQSSSYKYGTSEWIQIQNNQNVWSIHIHRDSLAQVEWSICARQGHATHRNTRVKMSCRKS